MRKGGGEGRGLTVFAELIAVYEEEGTEVGGGGGIGELDG